MAIKVFDRVKETTNTLGSGTITLAGAASSFQTFSNVFSSGDQTYYCIQNSTQFEIGRGTYANNTLSRDLVLDSSDGGSLISIGSQADVFVGYPASGAIYKDDNDEVVVGSGGIRFADNSLLTTAGGISYTAGTGLTLVGTQFNTAGTGAFDAIDMTVSTGLDQPGHSEGRVFYDGDNHALAVYNDEADITLQVGQEEYVRVRNNTGSTIFNGDAVRIAGSQGTNTTIELAIATGDLSSQAIGLATHDIGNNEFGYITTFGVVRDLDTSDFIEGGEVFLSEAVAGGLTGVSPVAPNYKMSIGHVIRSHPSVGTVLVTPSTPKLGGGDVKSLGQAEISGVAFVSAESNGSAAVLATNTGMLYDSGNQILQINSGGIRFPDGNTQVIAFTGADGVGISNVVEDTTPELGGNLDIGAFAITGGNQTVTASTPMLDLSQTWNSSGVAFTGMVMDITDTASSGTSELVNFQVDGASKFSVDKAGNLTAITKSFLIDHPTKSGKLQYGSLEGPENGVYVRGTTCHDIIYLPDYWTGLVDEDSITVQLTPVGKFQGLYVLNKNNQHIAVGGVDGEYDYVVYGTRKDIDPLEVEWGD